jgi:DNA (cytosine-5)-methyltransferase 1
LGHQLLDFARRHGDHPNRPVWGRFAPAIDHWAGIVDRDPPPPVTTTARGAVNPNPAVVEWLMGLPEGWVTSPDTGLSPARQVKALGNGVLPHQARLAISALHRYTTQDR